MLRFNTMMLGLLAFVAMPSLAAKWVYTVQSTQVTMLPEPFKPGGWVSATDINIHGQIIGWADTTGKRNGWLWEPSGVFVNVGEPLTTVETYPQGINNLGEVVGYQTKDKRTRGFYWHPSTGHALLDTELIPGADYNRDYTFLAYAINDFGRIAGSAEATSASTAPNDPCHARLPISWSRPDASPRVLLCPSTIGYDNFAFDVNNYGATVGVVTSAKARGFTIKNGAVTYVPWPADSDRKLQQADAVNEHGAVAGRATFPIPMPGTQPIYWDGSSRSSISLGVFPGGTYGWAWDVNDEDFVVGSSERELSTEAGVVKVPRAFLWRQELGLQELPVPPMGVGDSYWKCSAVALTNFLPVTTTQGKIQVAGNCWQDWQGRAVRWDVAVTRTWVP